MNKIFQLLITIFLLFLINSKLYHQQITLTFLRRNKGWVFLDRIKFAQGQAQIKFNTKLIVKEAQPNKTYILELAVVPDIHWNDQVMLKCSRQGKSQVEQHTQNNQKKHLSLFVVMNKQNNYQNGLVHNIQVPFAGTYHFILKDCQKNLVNQYFNRDSKLEIQLQLKNNGKQYGDDEQSNFFWFPLLIVGTLIMLKISKVQVSSQIDSKDTDWVKVLLIISLWLNFSCLISKYCGYLIYIYSGSQYTFFDFMYLLFHSVSESVIISIFVFVSYGWTITFVNGRDFDLYVPLISMMGLITVILTLLNKITDGTHDKYHMYDTIPAYLLIFFKVITLFVFVGGCAKTYLASKQVLIKRFVLQIFVLGFFYLSSIPLIVLIIENFPASQRKQLVFIVIQLVKNLICLLLTYMISYKKSGYRLISFSDKSFMQAGSKIL